MAPIIGQTRARLDTGGRGSVHASAMSAITPRVQMRSPLCAIREALVSRG